MRKILYITALISLVAFSAAAQDAIPEKNSKKVVARKIDREGTKRSMDISTNLFDWGDFGTINLDVSMSVSRHISLQLGGKYNGWEFKNPNGPVTLTKNQQKSASLGVRYWPWYVYSGWWICAKAQYCDYSECGVWRQDLDEGKAVGGGLSVGYTLMIGKHFNIEAGVGFWGGRLLEHTLYDCPNCMVIRESGPKNFIALNDINISLHWVF